MPMISEPPAAAPAPAPPPLSEGLRTFTSVELFGGDRELAIRHDREVYRLRITRSGKLILTK
jgi:hemin uptake protein HemP